MLKTVVSTVPPRGYLDSVVGLEPTTSRILHQLFHQLNYTLNIPSVRIPDVDFNGLVSFQTNTLVSYHIKQKVNTTWWVSIVTHNSKTSLVYMTRESRRLFPTVF